MTVRIVGPGMMSITVDAATKAIQAESDPVLELSSAHLHRRLLHCPVD